MFRFFLFCHDGHETTEVVSVERPQQHIASMCSENMVSEGGHCHKLLSFSLSFPDHLAKNSLIHERETHAAHTRHLNRGREGFFVCCDLCSSLQGGSCLTPHTGCEQCSVVCWIVSDSLTNARRAARRTAPHLISSNSTFLATVVRQAKTRSLGIHCGDVRASARKFSKKCVDCEDTRGVMFDEQSCL